MIVFKDILLLFNIILWSLLLQGLMKSKPTASALNNLRGKRSLIMSRSTFPGSGSYTGHTTGQDHMIVTMVIQCVLIGNNHASFEDLQYSISEMLNFQMFGIPLVGSDICGYLGELYSIVK